MAFDLPTNVNFNTAKWRLPDTREMTRSPLSGSAVIVDRANAPWSAKLILPPLTEDEAAPWEAAFLHARTEPFYLSPQHRLQPKDHREGISIGAPLVRGASQTGTSLIMDGLNTGFTWRSGDFLSFPNGSFEELHMVLLDAAANPQTEATVLLDPPIKKAPANNTIIRWNSPRCEMIVSQGQDFVLEIGAGTSIQLEIDVEELL